MSNSQNVELLEPSTLGTGINSAPEPQKTKRDYVMIFVVLLFLFVLAAFIFILTRPSSGSKNNFDTNTTGNNENNLQDPFQLPKVDNTKIVQAQSDIVVYEVKGRVLEFMSDFLLRISDSGEWKVIQESEIPSALDYQEIIIQKGNDNALSVVAETLSQDTVKVTVVPIN